MILVTGSCGLVGSTAVNFFLDKGYQVTGIDNNMREKFFNTSVEWNLPKHKNYTHINRDVISCADIIAKEKPKLIIHAAAQPSHDWSAKDPITDFYVNAVATLNLLEACRKYSPNTVFIFVSTNKVYGDRPNYLPLIELETRFDSIYPGIDENMSVDNCIHSPFGVSKASADLYCQEYGKYFGLKTGIFRCGCITGAKHSGAELHGFLSYIAKCKKENKKYKIYGYQGKQVRDNIHAYDLVNAFFHYYQNPKCGEVYNLGGGRYSNISVLEALKAFEVEYEYIGTPRKGDHKWYITDLNKFKLDYPGWKLTYSMDDIIKELKDNL